MTTEQPMLFDVKHFTIVLFGSQKSGITYNDEQGYAKSKDKDKQPMRPHHNHQNAATDMN